MEYSVLMSVYEKEKSEYLRESIESMLSQTVKPSDFVIVCDGPLPEKLRAVIDDYKSSAPALFQIVPLAENVGLGRALDQGLRVCRFPLVARMDSDDISLPDRCERQLAVFAQKEVSVVSGSILEFQTKPYVVGKERRLPESDEEIRKFARRRNPFNHPCVMYRRDDVLAAGSYRHVQGFEDYDLWVRMLMQGMRGWNVQEVLLKMRTDGMYLRRGGSGYARSMLKFRWHLLRTGFCNPVDFAVAAGGHLLVSLMPQKLRATFYERALRKL